MDNENGENIIDHDPNLKCLYFDGEYSPRGSLENILSQNPQIQSIELHNIKSELLKKVNSLLPNLNELSLSSVMLRNHVIRFENVLTFSMKWISLPKNLQFPKLQNLNIEVSPKYFEAWRNFLKNHNHVTRFDLKYHDLIDVRFDKLVAELPNVVEMSVKRMRGGVIHPDSIIKLLANQKLKQFDFDVGNTAARDVIRKKFEQIETEWDISNINEGLSFKRKEQ